MDEQLPSPKQPGVGGEERSGAVAVTAVDTTGLKSLIRTTLFEAWKEWGGRSVTQQA